MATTSASDKEHRKMFLSDAEVDRLFLEKNISEQCATGRGDLIHVFAEGPYGAFINEELGCGWGHHPSLPQVMLTVREDNLSHRDAAIDFLNRGIRPIIKEAKRKRMRTTAKLATVERGCVGCSSCVPEMRLQPHARRTPAMLRSWLPLPLERLQHRPIAAWWKWTAYLAYAIEHPELRFAEFDAAIERAQAQGADELTLGEVLARVGQLEHFARRRPLLQAERQQRLGRDRERQAILRDHGARIVREHAAHPRRRADARPAMKKRRQQAKAVRDAALRALEQN